MRTGVIKINNTSKLYKAFGKRDYILYVMILLCVFINIDLFSSQPRFLITTGFFWKGIALASLVVLLFSLIQWHLKKKKVIDVLSNGIIIEGQLKYSDVIKPNKTSSFNVHLLEYQVLGKTYEIGFKSKNKHLQSNVIIYKVNQPEKAIVFEDLRPNMKQIIAHYL
ncbi:hypothetical protein [uncultured Psychroserpens sp.]|uniref:hypothetical protein n=1 Tax=uncultured Psychroserpens sp. TaxID=255436 RepID=UPI0026230CED|nr:hypothetical protein [uncultured Psychroserpens sp.]